MNRQPHGDTACSIYTLRNNLCLHLTSVVAKPYIKRTTHVRVTAVTTYVHETPSPLLSSPLHCIATIP